MNNKEHRYEHKIIQRKNKKKAKNTQIEEKEKKNSKIFTII